MTRTWTYNAIALMAIASILGFAAIASAEETGAAPQATSARTDPRAGYTDPVRPGRPNDSVVASTTPRPILPRIATTTPPPRNIIGTSTRPLVRPGINASSTLRDRAEQRLRLEMRRMAERVLAAIHRMEELIVRIESRATKIDQAGGNTTAARTDIATAKTELAAAKTDLSTIQAAAMSIQSASNMASAIAAVSPARTAIESAQTHLRNAHRAIESAVAKLGIAHRSIPRPATTTPRQ